MLNELSAVESNIGQFKEGHTRMIDRENCQLRMIASMPGSKLTRASLDERRKAEMVLENLSKFGAVTVGIHGQELPKFSENSESKKWWKYEQVAKMQPKVQSRLLLKQN